MKPAITSEQWFRYSDTRFRPVRKAAHRVPRHSTGLASLLLFVLIVLVMYICGKGQTKNKKGFHQKCIFLLTWTNPKSAKMWQTPCFIWRKKKGTGKWRKMFQVIQRTILGVKTQYCSMMWNVLLHLYTGPFLSSYAQAQLHWICAITSSYGGKHALWMHTTECCQGTQEFMLTLLQKL